ncbi:unnamed protein product [Acanthosepion pharaonis]|uniref:Uncharacterized protein n=1 Tax=Acanthosepion pharaonis TaxID=158019 RepID=A0A812EJ61_ACAPH|nr:unnamed protein product [Sepia pharaonis]
MKPFYRSIFFSSQSDSLSIYMKRRKYPPLSLSLSLFFHNVHSFSLFFLLPTLQYIPSLLSHETFLSDDLFGSQSDSLSIYMKRKNIHLSLSLSLSFLTSIPSLSSFSFLPFNTFPPYYLMKPFYRRKYPPSLSLSLSFITSIPSLSSFSLPTLQYISLLIISLKPFYRSIFFCSQSDSLSIYMKRKKISTLSLSLSLSFYNVHSFSLFFLPSYPSIHSLPYYLMKPFYRRKYPPSLSLSLSLSLSSIPSLSSFSFLPFNTFPPLLSHETFLSVDLFSSQSDSLSIYMKRKNILSPSLSLSLSFHNVLPYSFSLFFLLPF